MNYLISLEELKQRLNKGVIIFDCRFRLNDETQGFDAYKAGHIPGAYYLDLNKDLSSKVQLHGGRHPLPDPIALTHKLRQAGVNNQSSIIVYDDSRFAYSARAWWVFKWLGLNDVRLLDGGFNAWRDAGLALDRRAPPLKAGTFSPQIKQNLSLSREDILAGGDKLTLIDSREARRFQGLEEPIDPIAGHIPGAQNFFWQDNSDERGYFKQAEELRSRWQPLKTDQPLGVYCGSGVTACVNILALEMIGVNAKLYPGSWSDWCSYPTESPIELSV